MFLAGNAETTLPLLLAHVPRDNVVIVAELCTNIPSDWTAFATLGQLPKVIPGIGVYYPRFFATERDFFGEFNAHHVASTLTESNKVSSVSYRKGVYITRVLWYL